MQTNETDAEISKADQSQAIVNGDLCEGNDRMSIEQGVINEPSTSGALLNSARRISIPSVSGRLPKLSCTMSRTEAVRQDVRRLKSVTLGRMGKMFKTRSPIAAGSSTGLDTNVTGVSNSDEKASRKERANSLGRMLKLVDKDGSPRKLFVRPRAGSLSRILRRHPHNEDNGVIDKPAEDTARGIISRMLSQLRGRLMSGTTVKSDKRDKLNSSLSSEMSLDSKTTNVM